MHAQQLLRSIESIHFIRSRMKRKQQCASDKNRLIEICPAHYRQSRSSTKLLTNDPTNGCWLSPPQTRRHPKPRHIPAGNAYIEPREKGTQTNSRARRILRILADRLQVFENSSRNTTSVSTPGTIAQPSNQTSDLQLLLPCITEAMACRHPKCKSKPVIYLNSDEFQSHLKYRHKWRPFSCYRIDCPYRMENGFVSARRLQGHIPYHHLNDGLVARLEVALIDRWNYADVGSIAKCCVYIG